VAGGEWWALRRGMRRCAACRHESSVTAGTIFHGSRLPLQSWMAAIWYVVNQKQGVSALGLQRVLGFGSYQTAWAWLHKLRRAMVLPGRELLAGAVEIDESYIGAARPGRRGRGAAGKAIVAIAVEDHDGSPGRTRIARIPNVKRDTLSDFVLDHVARGAEVRTDAHHGYNDVGRYRFRHVVVKVKESGDPAHVVMPHVHRVASLLKRWLLAPTNAPSPTVSSTTTSTSSPSASTGAAHATASSCSTGSSKAPRPAPAGHTPRLAASTHTGRRDPPAPESDRPAHPDQRSDTHRRVSD
jgi:transposase-like protein